MQAQRQLNEFGTYLKATSPVLYRVRSNSSVQRWLLLCWLITDHIIYQTDFKRGLHTIRACTVTGAWGESLWVISISLSTN